MPKETEDRPSGKMTISITTSFEEENYSRTMLEKEIFIPEGQSEVASVIAFKDALKLMVEEIEEEVQLILAGEQLDSAL